MTAIKSLFSSLQFLWLALTGGEQGCPRLRFLLSIAAAYLLFLVLLPLFTHNALQLAQVEILSNPYADCMLIAGLVGAALALLLAFFPLAPLVLPAAEHLGYEVYRLLQDKPIAQVELTEPGLCWASFFLSALALLFCSAVTFGLAWRRLTDAGRSPLFLLLGLSYPLAWGSQGLVADAASGAYLLGPVWLIILFLQRSRERKTFAIFR